MKTRKLRMNSPKRGYQLIQGKNFNQQQRNPKHSYSYRLSPRAIADFTGGMVPSVLLFKSIY